MSRRGAILQDYGGHIPAQDFTAQRDAANYYQRDKEQANQMQQQKQAAKAKGQGDAIDYITGLDVPDIGDNTIDLYNNAQLKATQDELLGMAMKGASKDEVKIAALPKLQKIAQGYTIAKNEYAKITEGVKDLTKEYPTGDMVAARNIAGKNMLNNIFEFDEKGGVKGYKDPSLISPDKNYLGELTTNQNLPKWYKKSGAFEAGIKKLPLIPIKGGTTRTDKFGRKVKQTYTGHGSIFDEPIMNDEGEQTGWRLKSEAVPLGRNEDGSLIIEQVMPEEQFREATSTAAAKTDFLLDFNKYLEETGVNPDRLDPRAKDILERKFAYDFFSKTGIHGSSFLPTDEIKEAPIKNITNNNIRVGAAPVPVMDIVTPVKDYFENVGEQKEGLKGIAQINLFNNEVTTPVIEEVKKRYPDATADNIYYAKDGNDIWVMRATSTGENGKIKINRKDDTPVFKLDDFSNVTGNKPQGQKSKNKALEQAQQGGNGTKPTAPKKEIKRSEIATKAAAAGYTVKEYEALLKQKGVSIKD